MTDYQKYINALRKCAKEHDNDRTSTGHIIVSDLCRDTANLLEEVKQEPRKDEVVLTNKEYREQISNEYEHGYCKGYAEALEQQESVFNEIRAEIEQDIAEANNLLKDGHDERVFGCICGYEEVLKIIDKYKAESEVEK